jgi:membrane-bound ClpP family serine protease
LQNQKKQEDEKKQIFNALLQEMKMLKKQENKNRKKIKTLIDNSKNIDNNNCNNKTINNNVQNNNNCNNNNINIRLVAHGKEDLSSFTETEWRQIITKFYRSFETSLIDAVHFDKNIPENHNIYISNIKSKFIMIYDGTNWIL